MEPEDVLVLNEAARLCKIPIARMSEEHVIAMAVLERLAAPDSWSYEHRRLFEEEVRSFEPHEKALAEHLKVQGLPVKADELSKEDLRQLIEAWRENWARLPHPISVLVMAMVEGAKDELEFR